MKPTSILIFLILLISCGKKKPTEYSSDYSPPEVEFPDEEDLDDLPEAGEKDEDY